MKIDMNREAVTLRLLQVVKIRKACFSLAKTSTSIEIQKARPANKKVQRTLLALGHRPIR